LWASKSDATRRLLRALLTLYAILRSVGRGRLGLLDAARLEIERSIATIQPLTISKAISGSPSIASRDVMPIFARRKCGGHARWPAAPDSSVIDQARDSCNSDEASASSRRCVDLETLGN